jgi:hypothetical protein
MFPPNTIGTEEVISSSCPEFIVIAWVEPAVTVKPGTSAPSTFALSTSSEALVVGVEPLLLTIAVAPAGLLTLVCPAPVVDPPPPPHAASATVIIAITVNLSFMIPPGNGEFSRLLFSSNNKQTAVLIMTLKQLFFYSNFKRCTLFHADEEAAKLAAGSRRFPACRGSRCMRQRLVFAQIGIRWISASVG